MTPSQLCKFVSTSLKWALRKANIFIRKKQKALKIGRDIFQANNLYSSGQRDNARTLVEKIIEAIANIGPSIAWPDSVKKAYTKFAKSFPISFGKNDLSKTLDNIDSFDAILEEGQDNPHIFALKNALLDLRVAVETQDSIEIEGAFYSLIDYYYLPEQESSLVST